MKISLVLSQPPGYSETFFRSKIKGLQKNGHQVILVTSKSELNFDLCKHRVHPKVYSNITRQVLAMLWVGFSLIPFWKQVMRFYQSEKQEETPTKRIIEKIYINATLLKLKTDWVHFGFATMALDRELVAKAIGAQLAVSLRGYDMDVYPLKHKNCYSLLWKQLDKVHAISEYLLYKAYSLGLSPDVNYEIITPAVDFDRFKKNQKDQKQFSGQLKLLTIARLHWIKGIDDLIETAFFLKEQNIDFEWKVIGGGDLKHTERYQYHVYQKQMGEQIKFLGKQTHEDTLTNLRQTDIYVQPSLSEGFCNAVLEAQALGKLCLAFDAGALSENILHEQTGWVVRKSQPKLLADKILEVIKLDEEGKRKIQENAIRRVRKEFTLEQQKNEFNWFYKFL